MHSSFVSESDLNIKNLALVINSGRCTISYVKIIKTMTKTCKILPLFPISFLSKAMGSPCLHMSAKPAKYFLCIEIKASNMSSRNSNWSHP